MAKNDNNSKNIIKNSELNIEGNLQIGDNYYLARSETSNLPLNKIKQQFAQASHILADYPNFFERLPNSHIERKETDELYLWIKSPVAGNVKSIAMLVGDAGSGKSVILKDLWQKLTKDGITTLGIKADKYYVKSVNERIPPLHPIL